MIENSREYAAKLREVADWLDQRPMFKADNPYFTFSCYEREEFVAAVKATKPGKKEIMEGSYSSMVMFTPDNLPSDIYLKVTIGRDKVCRKVQDAVWECEPILSADDERELTDATSEEL